MSPQHFSKFTPIAKDLRYYRLLPLTAGTGWFITLITLLIYWLASGRPRYPGQSNPYVAFISDIVAFVLQPVFIAGGTISAATLLATFCSVHLTLHWRHLGGKEGAQLAVQEVFLHISRSFPTSRMSMPDRFDSLRQPWSSEGASLVAFLSAYWDSALCNMHRRSVLGYHEGRELKRQQVASTCYRHQQFSFSHGILPGCGLHWFDIDELLQDQWHC
jgi:hypothetical protein